LPRSETDGSRSPLPEEGWKNVPPKSGIVETEFEIPGAGAHDAGRMAVIVDAAGSLQADVDRWIGQFAQPDGSATKDKTTTKASKLAGCTVTIVDIPGTYRDMPGGPFAGGKTVERPDYRMLAAIIDAGGGQLLSQVLTDRPPRWRSMLTGFGR